MKYLLDTHVLIWIARGEDTVISSRVSSTLITERGFICASAVSAWEMAIRHRLGKLPGVGAFLDHFEERANEFGLALLPMSIGMACWQERWKAPTKIRLIASSPRKRCLKTSPC